MIKGFRGTSLVDYPGKIAAVVFFGGCNFRCPFCYNVDLVLPERLKVLPDIEIDEIIVELKKRENFISGVTITGGEPTLHERRLKLLLERIRKETPLGIKLDTNGSFPKTVKTLLEEGLLDYVAIDFKTSPERYPELGGDFSKIEETLAILRGNIPFEIRITAVPYFITKKELDSLLDHFREASQIAIQRFLSEEELLNPSLNLGVYSPEELRELKKFLEEKTDVPVVLRNV